MSDDGAVAEKAVGMAAAAAKAKLLGKDRKNTRHSRFNAKGSVPWSPANAGAKTGASPTGSASYSSRYDSIHKQQPLPRWAKRCYRLSIDEGSPRGDSPAGAAKPAGPFRARGARHSPTPSYDDIWEEGTYPSVPCSRMLLESLDSEIYDFLAHMELTREERAQRNEMADKVRAITGKLYKNSRLEVFGSWHTDLCLPSSDIDFTLCGVDSSEAYSLQQHLKREGFATQLIPNSKVPLLRLTDPACGVQADISFNMWRAADSARNMQTLLRKHPLARPLIITLKSLLRLGNINELYSGGLSSYSLSLLVISYLQLYGPAAADDDTDDAATPSSAAEDNSSGSDGEVSASDGSTSGSASAPPSKPKAASAPVVSTPRAKGVGRALLGFLEAYGLEPTSIALEDITISVAQGRHIPRVEAEVENRVAHLQLEDPLLPTNDVAKGTFRIMDVRALFSTCLRVLQWFDGYTQAYEDQLAMSHGKTFHMAPPPATPLMSVFGCDPRDWGSSRPHGHPLSWRPTPSGPPGMGGGPWGQQGQFAARAPTQQARAGGVSGRSWAVVREKGEEAAANGEDTKKVDASPAKAAGEAEKASPARSDASAAAEPVEDDRAESSAADTTADVSNADEGVAAADAAKEVTVEDMEAPAADHAKASAMAQAEEEEAVAAAATEEAAAAVEPPQRVCETSTSSAVSEGTPSPCAVSSEPTTPRSTEGVEDADMVAAAHVEA